MAFRQWADGGPFWLLDIGFLGTLVQIRVGGTLIFSYIRRLGSFCLVQNFEFQYFLGFSEK